MSDFSMCVFASLADYWQARAEALERALQLAREMIVANGLDIPHTFEVIDAALADDANADPAL